MMTQTQESYLCRFSYCTHCWLAHHHPLKWSIHHSSADFTCQALARSHVTALSIQLHKFQMRKHLYYLPWALGWLVGRSVGGSVAGGLVSDFHSDSVSGPSQGVRRPYDVIYFLKAIPILTKKKLIQIQMSQVSQEPTLVVTNRKCNRSGEMSGVWGVFFQRIFFPSVPVLRIF